MIKYQIRLTKKFSNKFFSTIKNAPINEVTLKDY